METHSNGLWTSVASNIDFVLTYPNEWGEVYKYNIRRAVILAGLIPDTLEGNSRIQLLTEGEARFQFYNDNRPGLTWDHNTVCGRHLY